MVEKYVRYIDLKMFADMRGEIFIEHIQKHLESNEKVICKICGKDVNTIAEEEIERRFEELKPLVDRLREHAKAKTRPKK